MDAGFGSPESEHTILQSKQDFLAVYQASAPSLYAWIRIRIRSSLRNLVDPEDILQEVWLRGNHRFAVSKEGALEIRAWLFGVARNVLLEHLRRVERASVTTGADQSSCNARVERCETVTSIASRLARDEALQSFVTRVDELDQRDRQIVLLCGLQACSCVAAAERLGLSEELVKKRWQRLRERLRDLPAARQLLACTE